MRPDDKELKSKLERKDGIHMWADTSIEILGPASWTGYIEPGQEYTFTTSIRLHSQYQSGVSFGAMTRCGVQSIRGLAFFAGKFPHPIGYVTRVIVDSLGNYWHKHKVAMDSTLQGFVLFDSSRTVPLDTLYDRSGKVLSVQRVSVQVFDLPNSDIKLPGKPPKVRIRQPIRIQQKPTRGKSKGGA